MNSPSNLAHIAVLIPSLNPPASFPHLILELKERGFSRFLVVNDGSGPDSKRIFDQVQALGVELISYEENQGKGHALKHGLAELLKDESVRFVITADDDGQHHPDDILLMANSLTPSLKLCLGVRSFSGPVPLKSIIGNTFMRVLFFAITFRWVSDTQTGLRILHRSVIPEMLTYKSNRFNFESISLLGAILRGVEIKEIPIRTIYFDNNRGTRFNGFRDSMNVVMSLIKHRLFE